FNSEETMSNQSNWLEQGERPPWISEARWNLLPPEEREDIIADLKDIWGEWKQRAANRPNFSQQALFEEFELNFTGVSKDGQHAKSTSLSHGFGQGLAPWAQYHNPGENAAQYLNMRKILGAAYPATSHKNLCGELAVIAVADKTLEDGLQIFSNTTVSRFNEANNQWVFIKGAEILKSNETTWAHQLAQFFKAMGWEARSRNRHSAIPSPADAPMIDSMLTEGKALVALVTIDGSRDGMLTPLAESLRPIAHWVAITSVFKTRAGDTFMRVYNPYQNREELYSWPHFRQAWQMTAGNVSQFAVVVAEKTPSILRPGIRPGGPVG
ncbi:MAG: hypothetical protein AB1345_15020, partial [Chloroflexota bacterium]